MSYRLIKKWNKDPKAAAKESIFYYLMTALMAIIVLSDGLHELIPIWQIIVVLLVLGCLIWLTRCYAKYLQNIMKDAHKKKLISY